MCQKIGYPLWMAPYITLRAPEPKMSIIRVVTYASVVTKMHLGSPVDPRVPRVTRGGPGGSIPNFIESKKLAYNSCWVCFIGEKIWRIKNFFRHQTMPLEGTFSKILGFFCWRFSFQVSVTFDENVKYTSMLMNYSPCEQWWFNVLMIWPEYIISRKFKLVYL